MSCSRIIFTYEANSREKHRKHSDIDFMKLMADGSLDPDCFTHEAHIRLAWLSMNTLGFEEACNLICSRIEQFDLLHGDGMKFDSKLTCLAAKIIWDTKLASKSQSFPDFMDEYPDLQMQLRTLLTAYK